MMLQVAYDTTHRELLVDGRREDYALLSDLTRQAVDSGLEAELSVQSKGPTFISHLVVRCPSRRTIESR